MRSSSIVPLVIALANMGCSEAGYPAREAISARAEVPPPAAKRAAPMPNMAADAAFRAPTAPAAEAKAEQGYAGMMRGMMGGMMGTAIQAPPDASAFARKIIYDGEISLIVKDVDALAKQVVKLVQDARGYIAEQSTTGSPGARRAMRWKLRVPVEQFESVVERVAALGELERNTRTSQDVTEQFYDLEARIKNKKAEEKSLTKILDERTGKLEDVLKVETELSRVRGEIEQLEGKIRVLDNLSSLATLVVDIRERETFEPPPPAAADFPTQVARTWENSLRGLVNLGKGLVLWAVEWAVWAPLLLISALVAWVVARVLIRWAWRRLPRLLALLTTPLTPPKAP